MESYSLGSEVATHLENFNYNVSAMGTWDSDFSKAHFLYL